MSERYGEVSLFHQASNGSMLMWTPCCKDGAAHFLPAIPLDYIGEALYAMEQLHTCTDSAAGGGYVPVLSGIAGDCKDWLMVLFPSAGQR